MLSKLLRCPYRQAVVSRQLLASKGGACKQAVVARKFMGLVPPTQYDVPIPKRLHLGYTMRVYWETIPLVGVTIFAFALVFLSILSCFRNKVDVVFTTHNRRNISRTMDLRYPTVHKLLTINQRYEPWPELADLLDQMVAAEKRNLVRLESCNSP